MTQQEGFITLFNIILNDIKHPNYDRVVKLAEDYFALSTGEGLNERLRQFASRESEDAFKERKKITLEICSSVVDNLTHIFYRVPRSNGVKIKYTVPEGKKEAFNKLLEGFGNKGFTAYMEQKLKDNIELDPNKWVVVEFDPTDGTEYAQPYPYEVTAAEAIMFEYKNSELIYLVDKKPIKLKDSLGFERDCFKWTIYTKEGSLQIVLQPENKFYSDIKEVSDIVDFFNIGINSYATIVPMPYNLDFVPAERVGYLMDKVTNGETFVNMYDSIRPFLMKLLKINSEFDVTTCKHAHMQKIQYVPKCTNTECQRNDNNLYVTFDEEGKEHKCTVCDGTGHLPVTTGGLEVILLPFPENSEDIQPLDNMVKYIGVDTSVPTFQKDVIDWLVEYCKSCMYNSDIFTKQQVSETATEKTIEMENVYDTLYPFAVNYVQFYTFVLESFQQITGIEVEVNASVNKDFKLLTKTELIAMLNAASLAGANEMVLDAINDEIAYSFYGESNNFDKYKLIQRLLPFQNKSKEQQMLILSQLDKDDIFRLAFIFGQDIVNKLEADNEDFFLLTFERQKALFDKEIKLIKDGMEPEEIILPFQNNEENNTDTDTD